MILAHVTKSNFPSWPWTLAMAVDANAPFLFRRELLIQSTPLYADLAVLLALLVSFVYYVRLCTLVIWDITDFIGIACFSVQKKDSKGAWVKAQEANGKKE
ncbi:hypothetical protein CALVIDRAFT_568445 [Calocera viscosa TUFC12733]|uniref:Uncharacterized protein n=1 Tax=Calocera viscosa (strain TUFC12733) TaxID=1330018 RepID=A0A167H2Z5_CALVF|nr:hypothetical protein CALVIDRAFT_568445 [Calocera viscosa TUFC12733]